MRRLQCALLVAVAAIGGASIASAADMPVKAPVYKAPIMAPVYNWTGFYIGGHIGGAWSNVDVSDPTGIFAPAGSSIGMNGTGLLGGGQIGYNWQTGHWVLGVQGDFAWTGINVSTVDPFLATATLSYKTDWIGMLTGRVGYAWDNWLLYAKGGAAWVHNKYSFVDPALLRVAINVNGSGTQAGWTVGGGLEYGLTPNWSLFAEYDYIDLGNFGVTLTGGGATIAANANQNISIVKGGVNYKFGM
jgi:outer membrane immunogenic protein